jgi:PPE-repeat protein
MSFVVFPPEINSALMYSGAGAGPLTAAAAAWDSLAADLYSTATSYQTVISNLTNGPWQGPSAAAMAGAAAPYVAWLDATAGQAAQTGAQAKMAAGAYETAFAATVPPPVIEANRELLAVLIATNFLGQNTAAIAACEALYMEMWAQDGLAMDTYAATSQQLTALPQHTSPPTVATGSPGPEIAAVQSAGTNVTNSIANSLSGLSLGPLESSVGSLLGNLGLSSLPTSLAGLPTWLTGTLGSLGSSLTGTGVSSSSALLPLQAAYYGGMLASTPARMFMGMGNSASSTTGTLATSSESLLNSIGQFVDGKMQAVLGGVTNQLRSWGSAVSAQLASAHRLGGGLAVPPSWHSAAPAMTRAAPVLPGTSVSSPMLSSGMQNSPFTQALMGALSGRGLGNLGAKVPAKVVPRSPAGG